MVHVSSNGEKNGTQDIAAVDFRGRPVDKTKTGGWLAAGLILGTELAERICVMGISMNLVTYLVGDLHLNSANSATIVTNFMGTLNLLGLLGGFLADAKLGRYVTVAISATIATVGVCLLTLATTIPSMTPPPCSEIQETTRSLDKAAILDETNSKDGNKENPWLVSTMTQVEEVKMVIKLLPIWSTCILFWTVYSQMNTFTIEQATFMNRKVGSLDIPAGSLSAFLIITILLFTSLNEKITVPIARRITHNTQGLTSLQRVGIGLIFSIIAMVVAAIVEKERRDNAVKKNTTISAFWLVPQFFLVGAGEAFAYVGQLEFFIREAPERMKSMSTGLFLTTLSMGYFVSSLLVSIVDKVSKKKWLKSNLNKAMRHEYKVQHNNIESDEKELVIANEVIVGIDGKEEA
ncbi:hypothetical protein TSUD_249830 [Trifolium subterraneum]|nr:hypothetical protein TSUD_249830 [Trifolium subterraneum]